MLEDWLTHPLMRGRSVDDPRTTELRRQVIQAKPFLRKIYVDWYLALAAAVPPGEGAVLELGSGAGFLKEFIPGLITSEILGCSGVDLLLDGHRLPFRSGTLRAIVMTDVFHHLARVESFLAEAARCVCTGGVMVMIEPWVSLWSSWVYRNLQSEPFRPEAEEWSFPATGPLSAANGALPWIVFQRDRTRFESSFPQWSVDSVVPGMPFRYLLSGGVSRRALMPGWSYGWWSAVERLLEPISPNLAMFCRIKLVRREG